MIAISDCDVFRQAGPPDLIDDNFEVKPKGKNIPQATIETHCSLRVRLHLPCWLGL